MNKRGLSQVVTTLLFVLLALGAVLLVWNLVRGIIGDAESEIDITQFSLNLEVVGKNVYINAPQEKVSLVVKRNAGAGEIKGVNVILTDDSGQSSVFKQNILIGELESKKIDIDYSGSGLGDIVKIGIAPIIDRNGEETVGGIVSEFDSSNRIGNALNFDGSAAGNYIEVVGSENLDLTSNDLTLSAWIKTNNPVAGGIIGKGSSVGVTEIKSEFTLQFYDGQIGVISNWGCELYSGDGLSGQRYLNDNEWHHFVGIITTNNELIAYTDGVEVGRKSRCDTSRVLTTSSIKLGLRESSPYYWDGSLDDIRLYDRALSEDEISKLYDGDYFGNVNDGLVGWWKFDEGSGVALRMDLEMEMTEL